MKIVSCGIVMKDDLKNRRKSLNNQLKCSLGLFDAVAISIGATIGAGIFVVTGIVAGLAGPALIFSFLISAFISMLTAVSFSRLVMKIPKEGSVYEYAYQELSPSAGFLTGSMWIISNIFTGSAVSLGFGYYLNTFLPIMNPQISAVIICVAFTLLNILGVKYSAWVNNILVLFKISILFFFILFGSLYINPINFTPFLISSGGVFYGAYFIFFAYGGFARVAVLAEEIKNPERNIPKAMFISLAVSTIIYIFVGLVAIGLMGAANLASTNSPLKDAIQISGNSVAVYLLSLGALVATASVLLMSILGNSRMIYAMARRRDLPGLLCRVHRKYDTPYLTILLAGGVMVTIILLIDISRIIAVSTFALLFYYTLTNIAAFRVELKERSRAAALSISGSLACISLMMVVLFISPMSWIMGVAFLTACLVIYFIKVRVEDRLEERD